MVEHAIGSRDLGDDIDLFAESPSVLFEENYYRRVAEENGWILGYTWLGTPRIIARIGDEEVPVEFYDNIHDFYIPPIFIERSVKVNVEGVRVRMIQPEDHIVLKASSGRSIDIERLKEIGRLIKKGRLTVDKAKLLEATSEFEDREVIIRRLKEASII